jgi:hypothetical protein
MYGTDGLVGAKFQTILPAWFLRIQSSFRRASPETRTRTVAIQATCDSLATSAAFAETGATMFEERQSRRRNGHASYNRS